VPDSPLFLPPPSPFLPRDGGDIRDVRGAITRRCGKASGRKSEILSRNSERVVTRDGFNRIGISRCSDFSTRRSRNEAVARVGRASDPALDLVLAGENDVGSPPRWSPREPLALRKQNGESRTRGEAEEARTRAAARGNRRRRPIRAMSRRGGADKRVSRRPRDNVVIAESAIADPRRRLNVRERLLAVTA